MSIILMLMMGFVEWMLTTLSAGFGLISMPTLSVIEKLSEESLESSKYATIVVSLCATTYNGFMVSPLLQ